MSIIRPARHTCGPSRRVRDLNVNYPGTIPAAIDRYLSSGDSDPESRVWPGGYCDRCVLAHRELRAALVAEVRRRVVDVVPVEPPDAPFTSSQRRIELMVRGLFPAAEQEIVLTRLRSSVVLITDANIDALLESRMWDRTAWVIANMYLRSLGLETLGGDDSTPVGMSEETTCYVTPECLVEEDPFADFVVHEVAHIFHNCKRGTLGLRQQLRRLAEGLRNDRTDCGTAKHVGRWSGRQQLAGHDRPGQFDQAHVVGLCRRGVDGDELLGLGVVLRRALLHGTCIVAAVRQAIDQRLRRTGIAVQHVVMAQVLDQRPHIDRCNRPGDQAKQQQQHT